MKLYASGRFFFLIVFVMGGSWLMAQSADFCFKERGKSRFSATVYFSDKAGNEKISPEDFRSSDFVFFTIKTNPLSEKDFFKDKDIEDCFVPMRLIQEGRTVKNAAYPEVVVDSDGKIGKVILKYAREDLLLYKPIVFVSPLDTTSTLKISDVYFIFFDRYQPVYDDAMNLSHQMDYIATFQNVMTIINDAQEHEEIKYYSYYKHATETLAENAIQQFADSLNKLYVEANLRFQKTLTEKSLNKVDSIYMLMADGFQIFKPYFNLDFPKSKSTGEMYVKLIENADEIRFKNYDIFKSYTLSFLKNETYQNYKFRFFVDILARMVTKLDTLKQLTGADTLSLTILDKFPLQKHKLHVNNWFNDFRLLVQMLNKDVIEKGKIFNDSIINNLQKQKAQEHQPYLEIFLAFNSLSSSTNLFQSFLKSAIKSCSDEDLIANMEMWILSANLTQGNLSPDLFRQINKGIMRINQKSWNEAFSLFSSLTMQADNSAASWYYYGRAQFEKGETYSSENKFERALDIYPEYITPRIFTFKILSESERYEDLLEKIGIAISINDNWLFRYWKAQTLFSFGKNQETINEIETWCLDFNPYNLDQYFLLGDAYKAIRKYKEAEAAYRKTAEIDIYADDAKFNERMELLYQEWKK
jgi:tetratricopeptide (TPR) repeat protein